MIETTSNGTRRGFVAGAAATVAAAAAFPVPRSDAAPPASVVGAWSGVYSWPCVAIHLHLLPNGKILTWADDDGRFPPDRLADFSKAFVVSIPDNDRPYPPFTEIDNHLTNLFCSGHAYLPDGRLLVVGGHEGQQFYGSADVTIFNYQGGYSWQRLPYPMTGGRWYGTACTLGNGEVLVLSGSMNAQKQINPLPQVWKTNSGGGWRNMPKLTVPIYPQLYVAPDGRVYVAGSAQTTHFLNTAGGGSWSNGPRRTYADSYYGSSAMYDGAKILMTGGGNPPTAVAEVIDLDAASPTWRRTQSMSKPRRHVNLTILADGKVLATGGSTLSSNNAAGAVLAAELWNPAGTGSWSTMASMAVKRLYHSTAMLLPDGRVLSAGGGRPAATNGGGNNENCEIYSPPYIFRGPRPTIAAAPGRVGYGTPFAVQTGDAAHIDIVRLIRFSSVTHCNNMNQRARELAIVSRSASQLNVAIPANPNLLPPGPYLLFAVASGIPSIAKIVMVN
jgi:hypothetical protein